MYRHLDLLRLPLLLKLGVEVVPRNGARHVEAVPKQSACVPYHRCTRVVERCVPEGSAEDHADRCSC